MKRMLLAAVLLCACGTTHDAVRQQAAINCDCTNLAQCTGQLKDAPPEMQEAHRKLRDEFCPRLSALNK